MSEINDLKIESLKVAKEPSFEDYLTSDRAKEILNQEVFNTIIEKYEQNENEEWIRVPYFVQYIQIPFRYNDENYEENKLIALKQLAEYFEKAVELGLVTYGCLAGANSCNFDNGFAMVYIWPTSKYNWRPKEFNDKLGMNVFMNEGELGPIEIGVD